MPMSESYCLFQRRLSRGGIIYGTLFLVSAIASGLAILIPGYRAWAAVLFLSGFVCGMGAWHVGGRQRTAWKVRTNPRVVYWAHLTGTRTFGGLSAKLLTAELGSLVVHLRDGSQLDIDLPPKDLEEILAWLKEENPFLRCGPYDGPDTAQQGGETP